MIEAGSTRSGRWFQARRLKLALWVAIAEGIVVVVSHDITRWTVLVIGVVVLGFYVLAGRSMKWDVGRHLSWIAAASQAMAILVVLAFKLVEWLAIGLVGLLAIATLLYLFADHKRA